MSNLSQFFGGGGPSNIIRGSTVVASGVNPATPNPFGSPAFSRASSIAQTTNTGVFVDAANTYLTQGCRGDLSYMAAPGSIRDFQNDIGGFWTGTGSARILPSGEVAVTSGIGYAQAFPSPFNGPPLTCTVTATIDWEAVEYS